MPRILPFIWYATEAKAAAEFYCAACGNGSRVTDVNVIHGTPSGNCEIVSFELWGQSFQAMSAGPTFNIRESAISLQVSCGTKEEVDALWAGLSDGATTFMEVAAYPFSERFGWLQDKFGLCWQIMYTTAPLAPQRITPFFLYGGEMAGKLEEAIIHYKGIFNDSKIDTITRHGAGEEPDKEGTIKFAQFLLEGYRFAGMDSAHPHPFKFNEAFSLMVMCDTQKEIDHYWAKLSARPDAEQCGWLKDKFGVSWQIVPTKMTGMMKKDDPQEVNPEFLEMKKLDIGELEKLEKQ